METPKELIRGIVLAAILLGGSALLKYGEHMGLLDAGSSKSGLQVMLGLIVAYYGNIAPKKLGRLRGGDTDRRLQRAARIGGWAFTLAGLTYAALALLEPSQTVRFASIAVIAAALLVTVFYSLSCFASTRAGDAS